MEKNAVRLTGVGILVLFLLSGCSTLKGWFTPQGQKLAQARQLAATHPLGASALAAEALALEPGYRDAADLLLKYFDPGQQEFHSSVTRWTNSSDAGRWDRLFEIYSWQNTLATVLPGLSAPLDKHVEPVKDELAAVAGQASLEHWEQAKTLLAKGPGPRQARLALAEGRTAVRYDGDTPGLSSWLADTRELATQRVLVVPFFFDPSGFPFAISGPLGSMISRNLLEAPGLPELTEVFGSDRLVTLPGGGPARIGLISQPDALALASVAGQNIVLLGQISRATYQAPRKTVTVEAREKTVTLVDPDHPAGVEKTFKAKVTVTTWTTAVSFTASFTAIEVATGRDLVTGVRDATVSDRAVDTQYTGDREALTADDLRALAQMPMLVEAQDLKDKALLALAGSVADVVRTALK